MYEAQIAGQPDAVGTDAPVMRWMKRRSAAELHDRRAGIVAALREIAPLEFVNGGGTGSLESTASDRSVTELTAGSGLLAGHLFDGYRGFHPAPASAFALEVVRRPAPDMVTVLGGGWIASGPPTPSRQPAPVWPKALRTLAREAAGESVDQLTSSDFDKGDEIWALITPHDGEIAGEAPTYRGEGKAFL